MQYCHYYILLLYQHHYYCYHYYHYHYHYNLVVATRFFVKLGKVKVLDSGQKITE